MVNRAGRRPLSAADFVRLRVDGTIDVVRLRRSGRVLVWPTRVTAMLRSCTRPATLESHVQRLVAAGSSGRDGAARVRSDLAFLVECGALVSTEELIAPVAKYAARCAPPARIRRLGVPTRDRPVLLERMLRSYLQDAARHGRNLDVDVVDDSRSQSLRQANRTVLRRLAREHGTVVRYFGPGQRRRLAARLAQAAGVEPALAAFAFTSKGPGCSVGSARNVLAMAAVGELQVQADDDTVCSLRRPSLAEGGECLVLAGTAPMGVRFFANARAALAATTPVADGFLEAHETLLGRDVSRQISDFGERLELDGLSEDFVRGAAAGGRIVRTSLGIVGDSGMGFAGVHYFAGWGAFEKDADTGPLYRRAVRSRQVCWWASSPTLTNDFTCMGTNVGLDWRRPLAPFVPHHRNEDGLFAQVLHSADASAFAGFIPRLVVHQPRPARLRSALEIEASAARVETHELMGAVIAAARPPRGLCPEAAFGAMAASLSALAQMGAWDFEEMLQVQRLAIIARRCQELDRIRAQGGPRPWLRDLEAYQALVRVALAASPRPRSQAADAREIRPLLQRYSELLRAWPALFEAAAGLSTGGWCDAIAIA